MRLRLRALLLGAGLLALGAPMGAGAGLAQERAPAPRPQLIDGFETVAAWSAHPSDGVDLAIRSDRGVRGRALRLDFDFHGRGGYAAVRRAVRLDLPENYAFSFVLRGRARPNTFEFKLVDSTGDNVWWVNRRNFAFPAGWTRMTLERRRFEFAWGPAGGGEIRHVAAIEIAVTAGEGGAGSVWIDELTLTPLEPEEPYTLAPEVRASSRAPGHPPTAALDGDTATAWAPAGGPGAGRRGTVEWLALDFRRRREYGGLVLDWAAGRRAPRYLVQTSDDGRRWTTRRRVIGGDGGRDYLYLPETESRHLRLWIEPGGRGYALREIVVEPREWAESPTAFFRAVAADAPRGTYPRYLSGEQSYWTVVGVPGDSARALVSEDGAVESAPGGFALEPFLLQDGSLLTWHEARSQQRLEDGYLPIPSVEWAGPGVTLTVTAAAVGGPGRSSVLARYRVANPGPAPARPTLVLALRPFQVNPPWQFLHVPGGFAPIRGLAYREGAVLVNGRRAVVPLSPGGRFGAARFDQGGIEGALRRGRLPPARQAADSLGFASGALAYPLALAPGESAAVYVALPLGLRGAPGLGRPAASAALARAEAESSFARVARDWHARLDRVSIDLPPAAGPLVPALKANLAYILINRDGPAIQPGARAYRRSWIRDGSLISAALLRLDYAADVARYAEWYAPFQFPSGKVPCCVDRRGADPVPEHDSGGELIYLIAEYYRYTGDRALVERLWPHVAATVDYLDSLRRERMTPEYRTPERRAFFGLLPPSISHEGYAAKPMHSYWDDLFALKGFKDAADLAAALGREADRARFAALRDELRRDLVASYALAMARHRIDYLPGSVELGDFDPTSTSILLAPVNEVAPLLAAALRRTFERYDDSVRSRWDGTRAWESYTPYEFRNVAALLRLGWKDRALALLRGLLGDRRPEGWQQWAEVVWRDPRAPKFIGDMPHTWVGADFIRSTLDLLAYETDSALVVGAGVPPAWVREGNGVAVRGLRTTRGPLSFTMRADSGGVRVRIEGGLSPPPGGIVVRSPLEGPPRAAYAGDRELPLDGSGGVTVRELPVEVSFRY